MAKIAMVLLRCGDQSPSGAHGSLHPTPHPRNSSAPSQHFRYNLYFLGINFLCYPYWWSSQRGGSIANTAGAVMHCVSGPSHLSIFRALWSSDDNMLKILFGFNKCLVLLLLLRMALVASGRSYLYGALRRL